MGPCSPFFTDTRILLRIVIMTLLCFPFQVVIQLPPDLTLHVLYYLFRSSFAGPMVYVYIPLLDLTLLGPYLY